jgi:integrase
MIDVLPAPTNPALDKDRLLALAGKWRDLIAARGCAATFVAERHMQVCWVLEQADYELTDTAVQLAIGTLLRQGKSARTCGKYLQAIKGFTRWLARPSARVLVFDPLVELEPPNTRRDRRHVRTSFLPVLEKLLATTERSTRLFQGIGGVDRAELYHAAACTGLRLGTLMVVEVGQFHLDAQPVAFVKVRADQVKDGEDLVVPIQADSAARLREYLTGKPPRARAFRTPEYNTEFARMLRKDLADAGITYCRKVKLPNGRHRREDVLDFHALRHTFGTWCASANVPLTTTQRWMGHSTSELTATVYTHVMPADHVAAVAKLPPLPGARRQPAPAAERHPELVESAA